MHYSENGLAQGCVSFRAVEEKDGVIARMTVEKGTGLITSSMLAPLSAPL